MKFSSRNNVAATLEAGMNTGHREETIGAVSIIIVKTDARLPPMSSETGTVRKPQKKLKKRPPQ